MDIEQQRINYINTTMDILNKLCSDLYEALMDQDKLAIETTVSNLDNVLNDLNQTFKNEI